MDSVVIGQASIPMSQGKAWLKDYTDPGHQQGKKPYAYPAYDFLDTGSGSDEINGGDLLAPTLLNAAPSVSAFYRLEATASALANALSTHTDQPLAELDDADIEARVRPVYEILDKDHTDHPRRGLGGTTLSKVLHRKRPESFCLHDKWVKLGYVGDNGPVPRAKKRSWASYMTLLSQAMAKDLRNQQEEFHLLQEAVQGQPLSDLRILDILTWSSRGGRALRLAE